MSDYVRITPPPAVLCCLSLLFAALYYVPRLLVQNVSLSPAAAAHVVGTFLDLPSATTCVETLAL